MEPRIILKHLNAVKGDAVQEFPLARFNELTLGRDPECEVKFDPDREDLVSRRHAKVTIQNSGTPEFTLADLGSRNGTFLNKQRVSGSVKLKSGDVIQLGPGGPEISFELDPPVSMVKATRMAPEFDLPVVKPTREGSPVLPPPAAGNVSRATVERMITQQKTSSQRWMFMLAGLVVFLALALGAAVVFRRPAGTPLVIRTDDKRGVSAADIAQKYTDSVVFFEVSWKLQDVESGRQIFHVYLPNSKKDENGQDVPLAQGAPANLPVFVTMGNALEPMLSVDDGGGRNKPIGNSHTGTGFVVTQDGFILTNRHVAASWQTRYSWRGDDPIGVVIVNDSSAQGGQKMVLIPSAQFPAWVPANAKFLQQGSFDPGAVRLLPKPVNYKNVEGRNDIMDITLAHTRLRMHGNLSRVSDRSDVAMVKVDLPQQFHKVELFDNYDSIKPGDSAIVMGYPAIAPTTYAVTQSKDMFNSEVNAATVPDPTISIGGIGRIHRSAEGAREGVVSEAGDLYQLTINSTGGGNSGGPVFDEQGRVIAIFNASKRTDAMITFAVPIRFGMELMGVRPAR